MTSTLGLAEHGIEHAWRTGRDPTRPQPLIIRFRDTQARLAALRQRATLRDHPTIFMDEDLTPMQVEERRTLLQQRDVARQKGKWAVVRDGRLLVGSRRRAPPGTPDTVAGSPPK